MSRFLSVALIALAGIQGAGQSTSPQAQQTVETVRELRAIGLPNFEGGEIRPPATVPGLLRKLNSQLRMLITDTLNDQSRSGVVNENEIIAQLQSAGWNEIPPYKWNAYGEISRVRFDLNSKYDPEILVVSTELWAPCGSTDPDTAIYVFRDADGAGEWCWRPTRTSTLLVSARTQACSTNCLLQMLMGIGTSPSPGLHPHAVRLLCQRAFGTKSCGQVDPQTNPA